MSESQVELTKYPDGKGLASKEDGADGPHEYPNPFHSRPCEILFVGVVCVAQLTIQISFGQTLNPIHIMGDQFDTTNSGTLS
ncbi:hypothetical protein MMC26_005022 [Xylographa opegraphella]|nr:hypothetical protein [Xylographa opegraphella]